MDQLETHRSAPRPASRPRWHLLYFVLAAFDLLTISTSLYLNHQIMNLYNDSVRVNQEWAGRLASYSQLREQAGAANAPGNNVFYSHDVAAETASLRRERQEFDRQLAAARADLTPHLPPATAAPLLTDLDAAQTAMQEMTTEAELIFAAFTRNQPDKAGEHMAAMDRKYEKLNTALGRLSQRVRGIQQAHFEQQMAEASRWKKYEYLIAAFIAVMVVGVTLYGQQLARSVAAAQRESQRAEEALRRAHDELEIRVQARTAELAETNHALRAEITERQRVEEQLKSSREQLRNLAARLQAVREEERTRIARDLHDQLGQALTGLKMDLSWLGHKVADVSNGTLRPLLVGKLQSMSTLIDSNIQWVRKIATELRPGVLDDLGLMAAIEWLAQEFQTRTGIHCQVTVPAEDIPLDQDRSTAVFRICQEILTNVARHANAASVTMSLTESAGHLLLEVRDDGRGITEQETAGPNSLGLLGMRERALLLGGEVIIKGMAGQGTTVAVWIPRGYTSPPGAAS
jgi:signal transduction histidine kinase